MAFIEIGSDENCNRDCVECRPQFKTASMPSLDLSLAVTQVNDTTASKTAKGLAAQAEKDRMYIQLKLAQDGDAIGLRWKKKGKVKREALILEAQSNLYRYKWPELRTMFGYDDISGGKQVFRIDSSDIETVKKAQRHNESLKNSQLLPYLNIETLKEDPMRLLSLLHYRSAFELEDWVMFDAAQMHLSVECGCLSRQYNENCVILYGNRYGELVTWDRAQCHRWNCIGYPRAFLVLEAQSVLMGFLRKMVDIIAPQDATREGSSEWLTLAAAGFKVSGEIEYWSTFGNQAFSAPPIFDPEAALKQASAQLAAAEDHLRFLQCEPAYFHDLLVKQRGGEHFAQMPAEKIWKALVADTMVFPITQVQQLRDVVDECKHAVKVYNISKTEVNIGSSLPKEYERALGALELLCINAYQDERIHLEELLRASPGFHRNFIYVSNPKGEHGTLLRNIEGGNNNMEISETYFRREPLLYGLYNLCRNPEDVGAIRVPFLMGFVDDHLAHANNKERARIDQKLYDHLARMSVYGEILTKLRMSRPLASGLAFGYDIATKEEKQRQTWRLWHATPGTLTDAESKMLSESLSAFYEASLPAGKKGQAWLDKLKEVRNRLAEFWADARQVRRREVTGIGLTAVDVEEDVALFAADQTAEYKAEIIAETEMLKTLVATEASKKQKGVQTSVQMTWGETESQKVKLPVGRVKPKTRPDKSASTTAHENDGTKVATHGKQELSRIPVNVESLRIFAKMFPSSADVAFKGVIKWQHFVAPMADAGCSATHTGGSAVAFDQDASIGGGGSIVFHKPHPDPEVDAIMLQTMGKRLKRSFGWDGDVFVKREK